MSMAALLVLAFGLAMDAAAVSAMCGLATPNLRARHFVIVIGYFAAFQAIMPLLGWWLGAWIGPAIAAWDHWIAFVLLAGIGAKMIYDARIGGEGFVPRDPDPYRAKIMLGLAIATSIDAFAAGLTLPMFGVPLAAAVATIGLVTAAACAAGLALGHRVGAKLGDRLEVFGGILLIGLGTKILVEHLVA